MQAVGPSQHRRHTIVLAALLAACARNAGPPPTLVEIVADPPAVDNRAGALVAAIGTISRIEVVDVGDRHVIARLDDAATTRLLEAIATAGPREAVGGIRPAWDVALLLWPRHGPPFVAHPIGDARLRLNPHDPWSAARTLPDGAIDPDVREVEADTALFPALTRLLETAARRE